MDSSQNAYNEDTSALVDRLDSLERGLFKMGQRGLNSFQGWEKGKASHLTASTLVLNYRKRKMTDLQAWMLFSLGQLQVPSLVESVVMQKVMHWQSNTLSRAKVDLLVMEI